MFVPVACSECGKPFQVPEAAIGQPTSCTPADGSCSLDLLGGAADDPDAQPGAKRYASEGWYSGAAAWVGWRDLTAGQAQQARTEDAWQHFRPIFDAERDRLRGKYGGSV